MSWIKLSAKSKQTFLDNLLFDTLQPVEPVVPSALYNVHGTCFTWFLNLAMNQSQYFHSGDPL